MSANDPEAQKIDLLIDIMTELGRIEMEARSLRKVIEKESDKKFRTWMRKRNAAGYLKPPIMD